MRVMQDVFRFFVEAKDMDLLLEYDFIYSGKNEAFLKS